MTVGAEFKDPDSIVLRSIDWARYLVAGQTIASSQWIAPSGMTIVQDLGNSGAVTSARIGGGTVGETYAVTNRIVTATPVETLDQSIEFVIRSL
mgnify:CR=1 FL=1